MTRSLVALAAALALAACSTAPYQAQVDGVAAGFTAAKQAFNTSAETERRALMTSQLDNVLAQRGVITIPESCGLPGASCTPALTAGGATSTMIVSTAAPKGATVAALLEAYGQGLAQIAAARDVAEVKTAAGQATAAVALLAGTVGGPTVGAAVTAVGNFATWIVGRYLDQQRFETLRDVVARADPTIARAASLLGQESTLLQRSILIRRSTELRTKASAFARLQQQNAGREKLDAEAAKLVEEALAVELLGKLDPTQPYERMRAAHARLLEALMDPDLSPEAVFAAINELLDHAEKVQAALAKLGG